MVYIAHYNIAKLFYLDKYINHSSEDESLILSQQLEFLKVCRTAIHLIKFKEVTSTVHDWQEME